jgi:hypothetical protein
MGGNMATEYDEFTAQVQRHVGKNYSTLVPASTHRSTNLNPQHGLIIGCRLDEAPLEDLLYALDGLPPVWWPRWQDTTFSTFVQDRCPGTQVVSETARQHFATATGRLVTLLKKYSFGTPMLYDPKLRIGTSEIVMCGSLNEDAFRLYNLVHEALGWPTTKGHWGRIVLAEATGVISDETRANTNAWAQRAMVPEGEIPLTGVLLSVFTVINNTFTLANNCRAVFPMYK